MNLPGCVPWKMASPVRLILGRMANVPVWAGSQPSIVTSERLARTTKNFPKLQRRNLMKESVKDYVKTLTKTLIIALALVASVTTVRADGLVIRPVAPATYGRDVKYINGKKVGDQCTVEV